MSKKSKKKAEEEEEVEVEKMDMTRFSDIRRHLSTIADMAEAFPTLVNGLDTNIQQAAKQRSAAMVAEARKAISSLGHLESTLEQRIAALERQVAELRDGRVK